MALLALLGISAFALASGIVGIRLLALGRRTGLAPERLIGLSLFLAGGIGTTGVVAASYAGAWRPLVAGLALLAVDCGIAALGVFTWRVFRPTRLGATIVCACVALLFASLIADRVAGHYFGVPRTAFSMASDYAGRLVLYGWASFEALRQWSLARRRLRIGLGEALVANRFLLWGIATTAALGIWLHALFGELTKAADTTESYLVVTVLGGACALAIWLAFFPPRRYRVRFAARAARSGVASASAFSAP